MKIDVIYEYVVKKMSKRRTEHTKGVAELARELSKIWGENVENAVIAAILHDCTKEKSTDEQLQICEKYNIITDYDTISFPKCIHADTAAAIARAEFSVDDDVYNAIKYHTIARANMSVLEKTIFISDKSEKTRDTDYKNAKLIRTTAEWSLDEAMKISLGDNIDHMAQKGVKPHKNTMAAYIQICREKASESDGKTQKKE